ncbi:helix-turn-helix transcriptional regulator [Streptomyces sp. HPF1205]|uniref:helix-turn-helix transcriptional regulator n=1 Tax=Streptomyces sp. HPF1205 TaxID=2873262 RepID=UPI001CEC5A0A|nr:helix-turn-helix transcriptional regulator [Streptomyces sp. HPF1205]
MTTAAQAALRRVLAVFDLLIDAVDEDSLVPALLPLLLRALPGDSIAWTARPGPAGPLTLPAGLVDRDRLAAFARGAGQDPLVRHTSAGPGTPVRRSDLQSRREFKALAVYGEVYRPLGAEHQLAMSFPAGRPTGKDRRVCVCVNRASGDFPDADVETAAMLRGRLGHALGRLARPARALPPSAPAVLGALTRREAAVLGLLADGLSNDQIAHRLAISPRTVDKHLEHAYPKLHVKGRVEAANAWLAASGAG